MPTRTGRLVKAKELVPRITRIFTNRFKENCLTQTSQNTQKFISQRDLTRFHPIENDYLNTLYGL